MSHHPLLVLISHHLLFTGIVSIVLALCIFLPVSYFIKQAGSRKSNSVNPQPTPAPQSAPVPKSKKPLLKVLRNKFWKFNDFVGDTFHLWTFDKWVWAKINDFKTARAEKKAAANYMPPQATVAQKQTAVAQAAASKPAPTPPQPVQKPAPAPAPVIPPQPIAKKPAPMPTPAPVNPSPVPVDDISAMLKRIAPAENVPVNDTVSMNLTSMQIQDADQELTLLRKQKEVANAKKELAISEKEMGTEENTRDKVFKAGFNYEVNKLQPICDTALKGRIGLTKTKVNLAQATKKMIIEQLRVTNMRPQDARNVINAAKQLQIAEAEVEVI